MNRDGAHSLQDSMSYAFLPTNSIFPNSYTQELCLWLLVLLISTSTGGSMWIVTKFSYLFFGECLSIVFSRVSNLFFKVTVNWLLISQLASDNQSYREALSVCSLFLRRLMQVFAETILWSGDTPSKRSMPYSSKCCLSTSCFYLFNLVVLWSYLGRCRSIVFSFFFEIKCLGIQTLLDIFHFCLENCVNRICCFRLCLIEHSCLHRWPERCIWECVRQGNIARHRKRWWLFHRWY